MKKIISIVGSVAVILGVFTPLFNVPFLGAITYASQAEGEGWFIIGAALLAALCALGGKTIVGSIAGAVVLGDVIWTATNYMNHVASLANADNPFSKVLSRAVSPGMGFAFLIIGGIALLIAPFFQPQRQAAPLPCLAGEPRTLSKFLDANSKDNTVATWSDVWSK